MNKASPEVIERDVVAVRERPAGDFERLYRSEVTVITAYFARRSRDPETVADLTADTFVEAMRSFASFDPVKGGPRPWLLAIARRVEARHWERAGRQQAAVRGEAGRCVLENGDAADDLLARIDAERSGRVVMKRLAAMKPLDRSIVELVDIVGLTPKQAAQALSVSPGALRVRLFRARARLRKEDQE